MIREVHKVTHNGHTIGFVRRLRKDWGLTLTVITHDPDYDPGQYIGWHPSREVAEAELIAWAETCYTRLREVFQ